MLERLLLRVCVVARTPTATAEVRGRGRRPLEQAAVRGLLRAEPEVDPELLVPGRQGRERALRARGEPSAREAAALDSESITDRGISPCAFAVLAVFNQSESTEDFSEMFE